MMAMLMEIGEKVIENSGVEQTTALRDRRTEYAHSSSDRKQMYDTRVAGGQLLALGILLPHSERGWKLSSF